MADSINIQTNASSPKRVRGDMGEAEQHSLPDQIAADRHVKSQDATKKPHRGVRFGRIVPPGTNAKTS